MKFFWQEGSLISTNLLLFYRDMAIKYIKNSAFAHIKIIYVWSSCNYIISEFGIIDVVIISVGNYLFLVSEIPFWIQLRSKNGSLGGLLQKQCCVGIDWADLWVKGRYMWGHSKCTFVEEGVERGGIIEKRTKTNRGRGVLAYVYVRFKKKCWDFPNEF